MKKPLLLGLGLAVLLVALAVALPSLRAQLTAPAETLPAPVPSEAPIGATSADTPATESPAAPATAQSPVPSPAGPSSGANADRAGATGGSSPPPAAPPPALKEVGHQALDSQIRQVVDSMDRSGRPPAGVVQGGRRGAKRGVFENAERKLPFKPPGYYRESDVWPPKRAGRGAERLVFGRQGEVYYSADHYRSFVRLR